MPVLDINGQKVEVGDDFLSLSPEDQQTWVNEVGTSIAPPESPGMTDPRQSLGAGFGSMIPGLSRGSGAINYMLQGGAPGSYDQGVQRFDQRMDKAYADNPGPYRGGQALNVIATGLAVPGGGRLAARATEETLRYGGKAAEKVSPIAAVLGDFWKYAGLKYGGRAAQRLADVLKTGRTGRSEPPMASDPAPPPASGRLSQEMLDALKRGKFRHQYNNVKGGI